MPILPGKLISKLPKIPQRAVRHLTTGCGVLNLTPVPAWLCIWRTTPGLGIQNSSSGPRTEPCVNEVFSVVTSNHHSFDSQAPEGVVLVNDPRMSWCICMLYTHVIYVICVISFALIKCRPNYTVVRYIPRHPGIIFVSVRLCTTLTWGI